MIRTLPTSYTSAYSTLGPQVQELKLTVIAMKATNAIVLGAPIVHVSRPTQLLKHERLDSNYCFQKPSLQAASLLVP